MQRTSFQHTLRNFFTLDGIGTHSGAPARLTFRPGFAGTGIVFVRTDVADKDNVVRAKWSNVVDTRLCTVIANADGTTVSTVEHVLSACAALGLDNAVIEIDGPEVPIMDGSAREFAAAIERTGLKEQAARRRALRIKKTIAFADGDKTVSLTPSETPVYGLEIVFDSPVIGRQKYVHEFTEEAYLAEIAPARTFGFLHEVEALRKMGLARGSSLENAVGIDGDKIMNPEGLRFPDEFVRHKILDAIGDLYLAGLPIIGRYDGFKAGHAMNNKLLHALFKDADAWEVVELGASVQRPAAMAMAGGFIRALVEA
jgi:UDP-3-O-[3-hydroxymyristoyl] N-acetylglucosamine deacetylase